MDEPNPTAQADTKKARRFTKVVWGKKLLPRPQSSAGSMSLTGGIRKVDVEPGAGRTDIAPHRFGYPKFGDMAVSASEGNTVELVE